MANTKIFSIKINGLEESAKAVEILAEHLEELKKTGKSLKDISIDINAKSKKDINDLDKSVKDLNKDVQETNRQKLTIQVGDSTMEFNSLKQAAKELSQQLGVLRSQGQENSDTYRNLAEAYSNVRAQMSSLNTELNRLASPAAQLVDTISVLQGFTSIATVGVGIKNLFGIDNEEINESIKKITSLIGVLEGLNKIQEQMEKQTAFGKLINSWNAPLDKFFGLFQKNRGTVAQVNAELRETQASGVAAQQGLLAVDKGAKSAAAGVNIMKTAMRGVWFLALIEGIMLVVEWIGKGVKAFTSWIKGTGDLQSKTDIATTTIKRLNAETERFNKMVDNARAQGLITALEAIDMKSQKTLSSIQQLAQGLEGLNVSVQDTRPQKVDDDWLLEKLGIKTPDWVNSANKWIRKGLEKIGWKTPVKIKPLEIDLDDVDKQYDEVLKRIGKGETGLEKEMKRLRQDAIVSLADTISKTDLNNKEVLAGLEEWIDSSLVLKEALQVLDETLKGVDGAEMYKARIEALLPLLGKTKDELTEFQNELNRMDSEIKDNNIAAMVDGYKKSAAEIANARDKALKDAGYLNKNLNELNEKELQHYNSIVAKYNREQYNLNKEWGEKTYNVRKQIRDNILIAEKKGYALQVQQLKNAMADEIHTAEQNGILTGELRLSIQKKYHQLMLDAEINYNKNLETLRKEQRRREQAYIEQQSQDIINTQQTMVNNLLDTISLLGRGNMEQTFEFITDEFGNKLVKSFEGIPFDFNAIFEEWLNNVKDLKGIDDVPLFNEGFINSLKDSLTEMDRWGFSIKEAYESTYKTLEQIEIEYYNAHKKIAQLEKEGREEEAAELHKLYDTPPPFLKYLDEENKYVYSTIRLEQERLALQKQIEESMVAAEQSRLDTQLGQQYEDRLRSLQEQFNIDFLEQKMNEGKELSEEELRDYTNYKELMIEEERQYNEQMVNMRNQMYAKMLNISQKYENDLQRSYKEGVDAQIKNYSIINNYLNEEISTWGTAVTTFGNYQNVFLQRIFSTGTRNLKQAYNEYKKIATDIYAAIESVTKDINNLKNEVGDNRELIKYLEDMRKQLIKQSKQIHQSWADMVFSTINDYKQMVDQTVGVISNFLSTMNDTALTLIDNQLAVIEQELAIQQEAYDRAEEAANAHKDRMNDIEDELSEARGARREFLIDQLAQQEAAYLEDLAAQQRAAEEKEKLEKKQEALEKKRREQEKKANIQQAIINTYTAVSNALAVQPWFLGLALSAVALGLGMANVAAISRTPVYKDGGVIQGKRHSQGGVKVLGGQAEVEGGEYITNRTSTRMNLPLLEYINSRKKELDEADLLKFFSQDKSKIRVNKSARKFAQGGQIQKMNTTNLRQEIERVVIADDERPVVVSVVDVINAQDNVRRVKALSGLPEDY